MVPPSHRLGLPRLTRVCADAPGTPLAVAGSAVESIAERWLVEDRWWTDEPIRRLYFELILTDGRNITVFRDERRRWFTQRA